MKICSLRMKICNLRNEVDFLHSWAVVLGQIFKQIVSIRVMTLINSNVVASRHIKREEVLLPVAVHRSKRGVNRGMQIRRSDMTY